MALRKWPIIIFVGSIENRKKVHFGYGAIENGQNNFAAGLFLFFFSEIVISTVISQKSTDLL